MLEGIIANLISKYADDYLEDFDASQLSIKLTTGDVEIREVSLRPTALEGLHPSLSVLVGYVGHIKLKIPWASLKRNPIIVELSNILILASSKSSITYTKEQVTRMVRRQFVSKLKKLAAEEAKYLALLEVLRNPEAKDKGPGYFMRKLDGLQALAVNNIQVTIRNIHIRFEDPSPDGVAFGLTIDEISFRTVDDAGKEVFIVGKSDVVHKAAQIRNFAVYCNTNFIPLSKGINLRARERKTIAHPIIRYLRNTVATDSIRPEGYQYIVQPVTLSGRITLNRSKDPRFMGPRIAVRLDLSSFNVVVTNDQLRAIIHQSLLLGTFGLDNRNINLRPDAPASEDTDAWWSYAIRSTTISSAQVNEDSQFCAAFRRETTMRTYVAYYVQHRQNYEKLSDKDLRQMKLLVKGKLGRKRRPKAARAAKALRDGGPEAAGSATDGAASIVSPHGELASPELGGASMREQRRADKTLRKMEKDLNKDRKRQEKQQAKEERLYNKLTRANMLSPEQAQGTRTGAGTNAGAGVDASDTSDGEAYGDGSTDDASDGAETTTTTTEDAGVPTLAALSRRRLYSDACYLLCSTDRGNTVLDHLHRVLPAEDILEYRKVAIQRLEELGRQHAGPAQAGTAAATPGAAGAGRPGRRRKLDKFLAESANAELTADDVENLYASLGALDIDPELTSNVPRGFRTLSLLLRAEGICLMMATSVCYRALDVQAKVAAEPLAILEQDSLTALCGRSIGETMCIKPLVRATLSGIALDMALLHPEVLELSITLGNLTAYNLLLAHGAAGYTRYPTLLKQYPRATDSLHDYLLSTDTAFDAGSPLLYLELRVPGLNGSSVSVKMQVRPIVVVATPDLLDIVTCILDDSAAYTDEALGNAFAEDLSAKAAERWSSLSAYTRNGIMKAVESHSRVHLDISVAAPRVVLPAYACTAPGAGAGADTEAPLVAARPSVPCVFLDLGTLALSSHMPSQGADIGAGDATATAIAGAGASAGAIRLDPSVDLYDTFTCSLTNTSCLALDDLSEISEMYVVMNYLTACEANPAIAAQAAGHAITDAALQNFDRKALLKPLTLSLLLRVCYVPDYLNAPRIILSAALSTVEVHVSLASLHTLLVIAELTVAELAAKPALKRYYALARRSAAKGKQAAAEARRQKKWVQWFLDTKVAEERMHAVAAGRAFEARELARDVHERYAGLTYDQLRAINGGAAPSALGAVGAPAGRSEAAGANGTPSVAPSGGTRGTRGTRGTMATRGPMRSYFQALFAQIGRGIVQRYQNMISISDALLDQNDPGVLAKFVIVDLKASLQGVALLLYTRTDLLSTLTLRAVDASFVQSPFSFRADLSVGALRLAHSAQGQARDVVFSADGEHFVGASVVNYNKLHPEFAKRNLIVGVTLATLTVAVSKGFIADHLALASQGVALLNESAIVESAKQTAADIRYESQCLDAEQVTVRTVALDDSIGGVLEDSLDTSSGGEEPPEEGPDAQPGPAGGKKDRARAKRGGLLTSDTAGTDLATIDAVVMRIMGLLGRKEDPQASDMIPISVTARLKGINVLLNDDATHAPLASFALFETNCAVALHVGCMHVTADTLGIELVDHSVSNLYAKVVETVSVGEGAASGRRLQADVWIIDPGSARYNGYDIELATAINCQFRVTVLLRFIMGLVDLAGLATQNNAEFLQMVVGREALESDLFADIRHKQQRAQALASVQQTGATLIVPKFIKMDISMLTPTVFIPVSDTSAEGILVNLGSIAMCSEYFTGPMDEHTSGFLHEKAQAQSQAQSLGTPASLSSQASLRLSQRVLVPAGPGARSEPLPPVVVPQQAFHITLSGLSVRTPSLHGDQLPLFADTTVRFFFGMPILCAASQQAKDAGRLPGMILDLQITRECAFALSLRQYALLMEMLKPWNNLGYNALDHKDAAALAAKAAALRADISALRSQIRKASAARPERAALAGPSVLAGSAGSADATDARGGMRLSTALRRGNDLDPDADHAPVPTTLLQGVQSMPTPRTAGGPLPPRPINLLLFFQLPGVSVRLHGRDRASAGALPDGCDADVEPYLGLSVGALDVTFVLYADGFEADVGLAGFSGADLRREAPVVEQYRAFLRTRGSIAVRVEAPAMTQMVASVRISEMIEVTASLQLFIALAGVFAPEASDREQAVLERRERAARAVAEVAALEDSKRELARRLRALQERAAARAARERGRERDREHDREQTLPRPGGESFYSDRSRADSAVSGSGSALGPGLAAGRPAGTHVSVERISTQKIRIRATLELPLFVLRVPEDVCLATASCITFTLGCTVSVFLDDKVSYDRLVSTQRHGSSRHGLAGPAAAVGSARPSLGASLGTSFGASGASGAADTQLAPGAPSTTGGSESVENYVETMYLITDVELSRLGIRLLKNSVSSDGALVKSVEDVILKDFTVAVTFMLDAVGRQVRPDPGVLHAGQPRFPFVANRMAIHTTVDFPLPFAFRLAYTDLEFIAVVGQRILGAIPAGLRDCAGAGASASARAAADLLDRLGGQLPVKQIVGEEDLDERSSASATELSDPPAPDTHRPGRRKRDIKIPRELFEAGLLRKGARYSGQIVTVGGAALPVITAGVKVVLRLSNKTGLQFTFIDDRRAPVPLLALSVGGARVAGAIHVITESGAPSIDFHIRVGLAANVFSPRIFGWEPLLEPQELFLDMCMNTQETPPPSGATSVRASAREDARAEARTESRGGSQGPPSSQLVYDMQPASADVESSRQEQGRPPADTASLAPVDLPAAIEAAIRSNENVRVNSSTVLTNKKPTVHCVLGMSGPLVLNVSPETIQVGAILGEIAALTQKRMGQHASDASVWRRPAGADTAACRRSLRLDRQDAAAGLERTSRIEQYSLAVSEALNMANTLALQSLGPGQGKGQGKESSAHHACLEAVRNGRLELSQLGRVQRELEYYEFTLLNTTGQRVDMWVKAVQISQAHYGTGDVSVTSADGFTEQLLCNTQPTYTIGARSLLAFNLASSEHAGGSAEDGAEHLGTCDCLALRLGQSYILNVRIDREAMFCYDVDVGGRTVALVVQIELLERRKKITIRGPCAVRNLTTLSMVVSYREDGGGVGEQAVDVAPSGVHFFPLGALPDAFECRVALAHPAAVKSFIASRSLQLADGEVQARADGPADDTVRPFTGFARLAFTGASADAQYKGLAPYLDLSTHDLPFFARVATQTLVTPVVSPAPKMMRIIDAALTPVYALRNDFPYVVEAVLGSAGGSGVPGSAHAREMAEQPQRFTIAPSDTAFVYGVHPRHAVQLQSFVLRSTRYSPHRGCMEAASYRIPRPTALAERRLGPPALADQSMLARSLRHEATVCDYLYKFAERLVLERAEDPEDSGDPEGGPEASATHAGGRPDDRLNIGIHRDIDLLDEGSTESFNAFNYLLAFYPLCIVRNNVCPVQALDRLPRGGDRGGLVCYIRPKGSKQETPVLVGEVGLPNLLSPQASVFARLAGTLPAGVQTEFSSGLSEKIRLKSPNLRMTLTLRDKGASGVVVYAGATCGLARNGLTKVLTILPNYMVRNHTDIDLDVLCGTRTSSIFWLTHLPRKPLDPAESPCTPGASEVSSTPGLSRSLSKGPSGTPALSTLDAPSSAGSGPAAGPVPLLYHVRHAPEDNRFMFLRTPENAGSWPVMSVLVSPGFCYSEIAEHFVQLPITEASRRMLLVKIQEAAPVLVVDIYPVDDANAGIKPKYMVTNLLRGPVHVRQVTELSGRASRLRSTVNPAFVQTHTYAPYSKRRQRDTYLSLEDPSIPPLLEVTAPDLLPGLRYRVNMGKIGRRKPLFLGDTKVFLEVDTMKGARNLRISSRRFLRNNALNTFFMTNSEVVPVMVFHCKIPAIRVSVFSTHGKHSVVARAWVDGADANGLASRSTSNLLDADGDDNGTGAQGARKAGARRRHGRPQRRSGKAPKLQVVTNEPVEVLALTLAALEVNMMLMETSLMLAVQLAGMQVDNCGPEADYPLVLKWHPKVALVNDEYVAKPCLSLEFEKLNTPHSINITVLNAFFGKIEVNADQYLYGHALGLMHEARRALRPPPQGLYGMEAANMELVHSIYSAVLAGPHAEDQRYALCQEAAYKYLLPDEQAIPNPEDVPRVNTIFVGTLHIDPVEVSLSVKIDELIMSNGVLFSVLNAFGSALTSLENAELTFLPLNRMWLFVSTDEFAKIMISTYAKQGMSNLLRLLGSSSIIGNPANAASHLGEGVSDLVTARTAQERIAGIRSLAVHSVAGYTGIVSGLLGTVGNTVATLTLDRTYQVERTRLMRASERNAGRSIANAFVGIGLGLWKGFSGLVTQPMRGKAEGGPKGAAREVGKSLLGLFTKPTSGIVDFPIHIALGVKGKALRAIEGDTDKRDHKQRVYIGAILAMRPAPNPADNLV